MSAPLTCAGPRLIVPLTIEARVLTGASSSDPWSFAGPEYAKLSDYDAIGPEPFNATKPVGPDGRSLTGAMLHWALPDGLTHGTQQKDGADVDYPLVPNRWLVTRVSPDAAAPDGRKLTAWVIESDYLGDDGSSSFPVPGSPTVGATTRIGRFEPYLSFTEPGGELFLKAIGPGDVTFAAFVPAVRNVFSFVDELAGVPAGPLTYSVVGWYSKPSADPLFGSASYGPEGWQTLEQWHDVMDSLGWSVWDRDHFEEDVGAAAEAAARWLAAHGITPATGDRGKYPAQTLCAGMIFDVEWQGPAGPDQSGVPRVDDHDSKTIPQVAIANSAIDALSALVEHQLGEEGAHAAEVLEAFQYNQLCTFDEADGEAQLEEAIHDAWFGGVPGGTWWTLVLPEDASGEPKSKRLEIPPNLEKLLTELNSAQTAFDATERALRGARFALYVAWWRVGKFDSAIAPPPVERAKLVSLRDACAQTVRDHETEASSRRKARDDAKSALEAAIGSTYALVDVSEPPFEQPGDPVVLVYGARRAFKHGEDGRFSEDDTLFCRFSGQTLTAIHVTSDGASTDIVASDVPVSNLTEGPVPLEVFDLLLETFFLDVSTAKAVAKAALVKLGQPVTPERIDALAAVVSEQQTLIWNPNLDAPLDQQTIAELSGLVGTIPSKVGVQLYAPPWSPLYMSWKIRWYPGSTDVSHALDSWKFDGVDYLWTGTSPPPTEDGVTLKGRTVITPQAADSLASRLEQFLAYEATAKDPEFAEDAKLLAAVVDSVNKWDLLSQNLTGFSDGLIMIDDGSHAIPDPAFAELVGDGGRGTPMVSQEPGTFQPVRGGHWTLEELWIVDGFGQVFDPIAARHQKPDNFFPIRGRGVVTDGDERMIQLPPRLAQAGRLDLQLVSAEGDPTPIAHDPTLSPVCGWVVSNYLDKGLAIYDAKGDLLGEIVIAGRASGSRALWSPVPGADVAVGAPPAVDNEHLRRFVVGLLARSDSGEAFAALLAAIDEALTATDPISGRAPTSLSLIVGRPIAVVRMSMQLTLEGTPAINQAWSEVGKDDTSGFPTLPFPIQVGRADLLDDGVVGFFLDDDYDQFITVPRDPNRAKTALPPYVIEEHVPLPFDGSTKAALTLLLDPQGDAHASSGVLPSAKVTLPEAYVNQALRNMTVTFRVGPLVSDPSIVRLPIPANVDGSWSWIERESPNSWADETTILTANQDARLPSEAPRLRDGWLKLTANFADEGGG